MSRLRRGMSIAGLALLLSMPPATSAQTFSSGSTGEVGPFPPAPVPSGTTSITVDLATGVVTFLPGGTTNTLVETSTRRKQDPVWGPEVARAADTTATPAVDRWAAPVAEDSERLVRTPRAPRPVAV